MSINRLQESNFIVTLPPLTTIMSEIFIYTVIWYNEDRHGEIKILIKRVRNILVLKVE